MNPETHLFLAIIANHRELMPLLFGLPNHRRVIREAGLAGDLDFLVDRFGADHPDRADIESAALFAWLPADAHPLPRDGVTACR